MHFSRLIQSSALRLILDVYHAVAILSCKHSGERFKAVPRSDDLRSLHHLEKMLARSILGVLFSASSERFELHTLEEEKESKGFKKKAWTSVLKFTSLNNKKGERTISAEFTKAGGDDLKLRTVRMNSRSPKRKTCTVSKSSSDMCVPTTSKDYFGVKTWFYG